MSLENDLILFYDNKHIDYKTRFYLLMNLLTSNQSNSFLELIIFLTFYYGQFISIFFSKKLLIFNSDENTSDYVLYNLYRILRFVVIFITKDSKYYEFILYFFLSFYIIVFFYFLFVLKNINYSSTYNLKYLILNFLLKFTFYILSNNCYDILTVHFCIGFNEHDTIEGYKCSPFTRPVKLILAIFLNILSLCEAIFYQYFTTNIFFLMDTYYTQIGTHYWIYMILVGFFTNIMFRLSNTIKIETVFIIILILNFSLFFYYKNKVIFYNFTTHLICGIFHILYGYSTLFFFIFYYIDVREKGIIYIISSIIVVIIFLNIHENFFRHLFFDIPFYQITNKNYLLFYIKYIMFLINNKIIKQNKALLSGIIKLHIRECPNSDCPIINTEKLFLPLTEEWTDRSKNFLNDNIYLFFFIKVIMQYYISHNCYNNELLLNFSYYYLFVIGNKCQAIYLYEKTKKMQMNLIEYFSLQRLKFIINNSLNVNLKKKNEECPNLENLNVTYFYKYQNYKDKFLNEIFTSLDLYENFWKYFSHKLNKNIIDFNQVFKTTEKLMNSMKVIEDLWNKLTIINSGANDVIDFYTDYVDQINDDNFLKRNLEELKRKSEVNINNINLNYFNLLFKSEAGIAICNGDNGKEGIIENVNNEFCKIFNYKLEELKEFNIKNLMPKIFSNKHSSYMNNFIEIGEKKYIEKKEHTTYAKDKHNNIIVIKLSLKLFPILNNSLLFIGLIVPKKIDDIILIDDNFIIQGMSKKLLDIIQFKNTDFFLENDIPFYMICKNFLNFYKTFIKREIKGLKKEETFISVVSDINNFNNEKKEENLIDQNIEINENIELEYEIKIPTYMKRYEEMTKKNNNNETNNENDFYFEETASLLSNRKHKNNKSLKNQQQINQYYVNNNNMNNNENNYNINIITPKETTTPGNSKNLKKQQSISKEDIFLYKLRVYKKLFDDNNINELEDNLEIDCKDNNTLVYKFNFTFKKFIYGNKELAFIIRCIDNKIEENDENSDEEGENKIDNLNSLKCLKTKMNYVKELNEITLIEKKIFDENITNFFDFLKEKKVDNELLNHLIEYKNEIKNYSRLNKKSKQNESMEDENLSQSNGTGFNPDLSRINKILEIRRNTLKNNSNYYTLKYFLILPIILFISSLFFAMFLLVSYYSINENLQNADQYNVDFYLCIIRMSNIISSIISLKKLIDLSSVNEIDLYNSFIADKEEYFSYLVNNTLYWYQTSFSFVYNLERNKHIYAGKNVGNEKKYMQINYYSNISFYQSFPYFIFLRGSLSNSKTMLSLKNFKIYPPPYSYDANIEILYQQYNLIENSFDIILPNSIEILDNNQKLLKNYNDKQINTIIILILIYLIITIICVFSYLYVLLITNKYMGTAIEKLVKISQDKINELIEKIITFRENYIKEMSIKYNEQILVPSNNININQNENEEKNKNNNNNDDNLNDFSLDIKKNKKLNLQNSNYIHLALIFIIDIIVVIVLYIIINNIIKLNRKILRMHQFFLGKYLKVALSTIYIKCEIFGCKNNNELDFESFFDETIYYEIISIFPNFPLIYEYYYKFYLNDSCRAEGKEFNSEEYNNCYNNSLIKSFNNTNNFINFIFESVNNFVFEIQSGKSPDNLVNSYIFNNLEEALYLRVIPTIMNFIKTIEKAVETVFNKNLIKIITILVCYAIVLILFIEYIKDIFIPKIKYSLSVTKCLIRIIPTSIISTNKDLEIWLDKINN